MVDVALGERPLDILTRQSPFTLGAEHLTAADPAPLRHANQHFSLW